ncbi:MAG TPA: aromatic ring-hydroxylating dioxygenase subunit alpha [Ideonella sp.]|nr:aromatic ring-hydroxylating dioxygenase subunit alpha [Ideonella sp.]
MSLTTMPPVATANLPAGAPAATYADHATPLVRNCWYVAGRSAEISREIISRRLLGIDVALYRTLDGRPVAVRNRCPHRSFPLAKGQLVGDLLVCGYHGMQFDASGQCVHMPSMATVPANARVRGFPLAERAPLVWIWMGDPALADEALVPETPWLSGPAWRSVTGDFHIRTDYVAMHENLLDQTHFPFLHPGTVGTPEYARSKLDVRQQGEVVIIDRALRNSAPPGIYGVPAGIMHKQVDRFSEARFASPALHTAFAKIVDLAPEPGALSEYRFNITHLITPETQGSIHYWWFNSRSFKLDDEAADRFLFDASVQAYLEDVEALQWILDGVLSDPEPQTDLSFGPDRPGLLMRRGLARRAAAEAEAGAAA